MFIHTQHASEIAENSVALLVEVQRKLKYVQLGAACGPRPVAKYEPAFSPGLLYNLFVSVSNYIRQILV